MNKHEFHTGQTFDAYDFFGAHITKDGVVFRTYAPNAKKIVLIGEFNEWQEQEMKKEDSGICSIVSPKAKTGQMYKYRIYCEDGRTIDHCDPYGFGMELRPNNATYIVDLAEYKFSDRTWMENRDKNYQKPLNIYEVHLGSWKTNKDNENGWYRYDEIAEQLIEYVKEWGYTHIEIMPLSEHPSDASWGYQNTGFFSPTSRYGTARDLMKMVDKCHQAGIGVIIDFVPVHFAVDDFALNMYDGTALYEYPHSDVGVSEWGTRNFMHSRGEVASFVQSAANYWLKEYHFDGIRMDAISRAIYWQGDEKRGVNSKAVEFVQTMNKGLQERHPTTMLFAEDSTAFPNVTVPIQHGGLGFDYKWDMGWMNDTLEYFKTSPEKRHIHYHKLLFSMQYFYSELFLLPFSHDEVVHGKGTIVQKMWGDYEDKFSQCRALYLYMYAHPGKKLNFMGNEFAQFREWDEKRGQDWEMLTYPLHDAFHHYIKELNHLYGKHPALYAEDYNKKQFHWLEANAPDQSVYIFERGANNERIIAAFNFSNMPQKGYTFNISEAVELIELIRSDACQWGGTEECDYVKMLSQKGKTGHTLQIDLPAFSGRLFKVEKQ